MIRAFISLIEQWRWRRRYLRRLGRATVTELPHYGAAELAGLDTPALVHRQMRLEQGHCEYCGTGSECLICGRVDARQEKETAL
jgi:hypothetical protein